MEAILARLLEQLLALVITTLFTGILKQIPAFVQLVPTLRQMTVFLVVRDPVRSLVSLLAFALITTTIGTSRQILAFSIVWAIWMETSASCVDLMPRLTAIQPLAYVTTPTVSSTHLLKLALAPVTSQVQLASCVAARPPSTRQRPPASAMIHNKYSTHQPSFATVMATSRIPCASHADLRPI